MRLEAEFTSEPFRGEGAPPEHALAARDAAVEAGLETDFGPLGTLARGEAKALLDAIPAIAKAALEGGATQVTLQVRHAGTDTADAAGPAGVARADVDQPADTGRAAGPAGVSRAGADEPAGVSTAAEPRGAGTAAEPTDADMASDPTSVRTPGATAGPRGTSTAGTPETVVELTDALARLIADLEREMGARLGELDRAGKQRAVRILRERGAFGLRKSVSSVADALGVTRFTVYNYLNREAD